MYIYMILAALVIVLIRAIVGPNFANRAIAISIVSNIAVLLIVVFSVSYQNPLYLDIALLFAMLSFTGLLAVAKFAVWHEERRREGRHD
jgi:multicomponent Na+:H+ antiporter subunit F